VVCGNVALAVCRLPAARTRTRTRTRGLINPRVPVRVCAPAGLWLPTWENDTAPLILQQAGVGFLCLECFVSQTTRLERSRFLWDVKEKISNPATFFFFTSPSQTLRSSDNKIPEIHKGIHPFCSLFAHTRVRARRPRWVGFSPEPGRGHGWVFSGTLWELAVPRLGFPRGFAYVCNACISQTNVSRVYVHRTCVTACIYRFHIGRNAEQTVGAPGAERRRRVREGRPRQRRGVPGSGPRCSPQPPGPLISPKYLPWGANAARRPGSLQREPSPSAPP